MRKWLGWLAVSFFVFIAVLLSWGSVQAKASDLTKAATIGKPGVSVLTNGTYVLQDNDNLLDTQDYKLTYNWTIPNGQAISAGDTLKVAFPETANAKPGVNFDIVSTGDKAKVVGHFVVDSGGKSGTITFNDVLSGTTENRQGNLTINHVSGTVKDTSTGTALISKNGWSDGNGKTNGIPNKVVWKVVLNPNKETWGTVELTDKLGLFQTYGEKLYIQQNGVDMANEDAKVTIDGPVINIKLLNVTGEIEIAYTTNVDTAAASAANAKTLDNSAEFKSQSGTSGGTGSESGPVSGDAAFKFHFYDGDGGAGGTTTPPVESSSSTSTPTEPSTPSVPSTSSNVPSTPSVPSTSSSVPSTSSIPSGSVDVPGTPPASSSSVSVPGAPSDSSESSSDTSTNASHNGSNGGNPSNGSSTKTSSADVVDGGNDADGGDGNQPQSGGGVPVTGNGGHGDGSRGSGISRLPQTNDDQKATALFLGILMLGGTLSYVQWRRNRS